MPAAFSEDDLIATYFAPLAGPAGLGLKDDAAVFTPAPGRDIVATKDAIVGGVHFFTDDAAGDIARKALRVNLSDLAAKGATPLGFLLALALPAGTNAEWLAAFAEGLGADAREFGFPLMGGDTVSTPGPLMVSVTALGTVPQGRMVLRSGARAGDLLYVSGTIGDAALGLRMRLGDARDAVWRDALPQAAKDFLTDRYLMPRPRTVLAASLLDSAHGAMDVSDGLVGDATKMLKVSGTGAMIHLAQIPLSEAAREAIALEPALIETALTGGDDYEILCSVPAARATAFEASAATAGVMVTRIGIAQGDRPIFLDADGKERRFERGSYSHF